jgi:hypothetical protein
MRTMKSTANSLEILSKSEFITAFEQAKNALRDRERDNVISYLQEKLRLVGANVYGARSERRDKDPHAYLFNDVDALVSSSDVEEFVAGGIALEGVADKSLEETSTPLTRRPSPMSVVKPVTRKPCLNHCRG